MLSHLSIRNFVLVNNISLDFESGLSIITGESGAGKSILLNALGLALGERGSPSLVREGATKTEINAIFNIGKLRIVKEWLGHRDLLSDDECILRRIIAAEGSSRAFINGTAVTLDELKDLSALIISMQDQSSHHNLMKKQNHINFIDDYGNLAEYRNKYQDAYMVLLGMKKELQSLCDLGKGDARALDLLKHELDELDAMAISAEEYSTLEEEHNRLNNAGDLLEAVHKCLSVLSGDGGMDGDDTGNKDLLSQLSSLQSALVTAKDKKLNTLAEGISQAEISLKDVETELKKYKEMLDIDPGRSEEINAKMSDLYRLARKHNVLPEELKELGEKLKKEWEDVSQLDEKLRIKEEEINKQDELCREIAAELTAKRKEVVPEFNEKVTREMSKLQMTCRFATRFTYNEKLGPGGDTDIEFLLATNPNAKLLPLKSIASGGELSRAALAISMIVAQNSAVPCLVFDEADSGIGGRIAARVGQGLSKLGRDAQVISITHQPQTAVYADQHYAVVKSVDLSDALSTIRILNQQERQQEIARMVGSDNIEQDALSYASKLMDQARLNVG